MTLPNRDRRWNRAIPAGGAMVVLAAAAACGVASASGNAMNPPAQAALAGPTDPSGVASPAADADGSSAAAPLAEVVVTAQKRAQKLQEVPAAVAVITPEEITRSNAVTMEGLLNQVPDLGLHKGDIPFNSSFFLRGVGTNSFALGAEPSVAYVLDGVVMGTSGQAFGDLVDVARVEVIPGPQGTLFGKNASAGVINVVSRMPGPDYDAELELGYFEGDETRMRASVDLPLGSRLLTRTTVFSGKYAGNITNLYEPTQNSQPAAANGYDHQGARSIWRLSARDDLTFTLIGAWRQSHDNCCAFVNDVPGSVPKTTATVVAGIDQLLAPVRFDGVDTREIDQSLTTQSTERERALSLQTDWSIARFTVTDIVSYRYWWFNEIRDGDFLPATAAYVGTSFEQVHDIGPQTTSTFTNELRLTSPTGGVLEYVAGLYYYHTAEDRYFERDLVECSASTLKALGNGLVPCLPGASTYVYPSANGTYGAGIVNYAAFGQGTIRIVQPLRLILGLRETHDEIGIYHNYNPSPLAGGGIIAVNCKPQPQCLPFEGGARTSHANLSGKAGLQWDVTPSEMAYFTYSRGYKGPAYNVYFNQTVAQSGPLPAETSVALELGLKSSFLNDNAYVNFALYHEAFNNFQANNPVLLNGVGVTTLADAGTAATQGFELTGAARLTPAWTVNGGLAYTNAHVVQFFDPPGSNPLAIAPPGSRLPFAPKLKYNIATDYRWSGPLPFDVLLHTDFDHTSDWYTDFATCTQAYCPNGGPNPYLRLRGYGIWSASLGASDREDRLTLTFLVRNILNDHYASHSAVGGPGGSVQYFIPRDADRYWGLQLDYKLGE